MSQATHEHMRAEMYICESEDLHINAISWDLIIPGGLPGGSELQI